MSKLEEKVAAILLHSHISFQREKFITDLRNGRYKFDFFLPAQNIAIEVQGEQHYKYSSYFHKKKSDFLKAQERDRSKIAYCLAHKIRLYCIPFWDFDGINKREDLFRSEYLATNKFHNDIVYREYKKRPH